MDSLLRKLFFALLLMRSWFVICRLKSFSRLIFTPLTFNSFQAPRARFKCHQKWICVNFRDDRKSAVNNFLVTTERKTCFGCHESGRRRCCGRSRNSRFRLTFFCAWRSMLSCDCNDIKIKRLATFRRIWSERLEESFNISRDDSEAHKVKFRASSQG